MINTLLLLGKMCLKSRNIAIFAVFFPTFFQKYPHEQINLNPTY